MKKKVLSFLLCLCMVVSLLPSVAFAASTVTPTTNDLKGLSEAFSKAQNGDTIKLNGDITTGTGIGTTINVSKAVTLDLNNYTITHNGIGESINNGSILFKVDSGGDLTLKNGTITLSGQYALIADSYGKLTIESGNYSNTAESYGGLFNSTGGELNVKGGTLSTKSYYTLFVVSGCKLSITGGTISNQTDFTVVSVSSPINMSGGTVEGKANSTVYLSESNSSLSMSGGTIQNTGSGFGLFTTNSSSLNMSGGEINSSAGGGIYNKGSAKISGTAKITAASTAIDNIGTLTLEGNADIRSTGGIGIVNRFQFTMNGGTLQGKTYSLQSSNGTDGSTKIAGGKILSDTNITVIHAGEGVLNIIGGEIKTNGQCPVYNHSSGKISYRGGSVEGGSLATFSNNSTGTIQVQYGNIPSIINFDANGKIIIDGGSVKLLQGATPKNSTGTALRQYPIQISGKQNTPIKSGDLAFDPAVTYSFDGVSTDKEAMVYLWLPSDLKTATYGSGADEKTGGMAGEGGITVLPNFVAQVKVYLNGEMWTACNKKVVLSTKSTSSFALRPEQAITSDSGANNGVYTFSGLDGSKTYYIWAEGVIGYTCLGEASADVLTGTHKTAQVDYYSVTLKKDTGISDVYIYCNTLLKGSDIDFSASLENGYRFKNWIKTGSEPTVYSTEANAKISKIDAPFSLTAVGTLNVYDATVTVKKDNVAWTDYNKAVVLSPSNTKIDAEGAKSVTASGETITFTDLDPRVATYYVWAGGVLTDQTINGNSTAATLDFYTVTLTKGENISSISESTTVLKGGSATITATAAADKIFSRWQQTTGGALYSSDATTTITNITAPFALTAVGAVDKFNVSVTINLDGGDNWAKQGITPHKLVLSASDKECGAIAGTYANGVYTFSKLSGSGVYYLWDADTMQLVSSTAITDKTNTATADYFTVTVENDDTANITAVTGGGVYLKGSTVTLTATPKQYYRALWKEPTTVNNTYTIDSIGIKTIVTVTSEVAKYTGKVSLKLDDGTYNGATVKLQAGNETAIQTTETNGVYSTATNALDPTKTYKIIVGDEESGVTLNATTNEATLDYYSVKVTGANVTVSGNNPSVHLKDSTVTLTATANNGYDLIGWYDSGTLLSTATTFTLSAITKPYTLTASASNTFDGVVIVSGMAVNKIELSDGTDKETTTSTGSPYTFTNLDRSKSYKVLLNGTDTGKTVSKTAPSAVLQYYTVTLNKGNGVSSVNGADTYLAGSNVEINATVESGYTFSRWDGDESLTGSNVTISGISKDYQLTASAYLPYTGTPFTLNNDQLVIEDSDTTGKIKVTQNGVVTDNIDPNANFIITGSSTINEAILILATRGATVQLKDVDIKVAGEKNYSALNIADTAGTVKLILNGKNVLSAQNAEGFSTSGSVALLKNNNALLTIESLDGTTAHSLTANGIGICSAGIGNYYPPSGIRMAQNITINSGTVTASGGGSSIGVFHCTTSGITINGGLLTLGIIGSAENKGSLSGLTINGGTVLTNAGTDYDAFSAQTVSGVTFNGGSIRADIYNCTPINKSSATLTMVTVTTDQNSRDVSTLKLTKSGDTGYTYNTKDMWADANGNIYLWLPNGTYTLTLGEVSKTITVPTNTTADLTPPVKTYSVNNPSAVTQYGVTFTSAVNKTSAINSGDTVTVTVSLSGKALKAGTYTVGLSGTGIGTVAAQTVDVTQDQNQSGNMSFSFKMPAADITDLAVGVTFAETAKHAVTYLAPDADGGSVPATVSYYEGQDFRVAENTGSLTRTGYTFAGWSEDGINTAGGSRTMPNQDVKYSALWTANTYSVRFHSNFGTDSVTEQTLTYNTPAKLTANAFTRDGYTFVGWAESNTGAKKFVDEASIQNLSSTKDAVIKLYALWTPKAYTVTFAANGGSGTMENQSYLRDVAQELSANALTRTGYTFAGWKDGSNKTYVNGESVTLTGDITLTAQWTPISYNVKFDANGGTGSIENQELKYDTAQNLTENTDSISRTGYTFDGWNTKSDGKGTPYADNASVKNLSDVNGVTVTLYAVWKANTCTVSFNANGGTGSIEPQKLTYDELAKLSKNTTITRTGYSFAGWNTKEDGSGTKYVDEASVKNLSSDKVGAITLYAQWGADIYTITFANGGGTGRMPSQTFATGDNTAISTSTFTKPGYSSDGWKDDKDKEVAGDATVDTVGRSTTLTAQWKANTYTIEFNGNGATSGSTAAMSNVTYEDTVALTNNGFARTGYKFVGWSDSPSATTPTYENSANVSKLSPMQNGVVTLYAVWRSDTYKVSFMANGGKGLMPDLTITNGESGTLPASSFERDNYKFSGWNTSEDGKGTYYPAGATVSFTPDSTGKVTLYAMWTENVRYNISGTVKNDATPQVAISGATLTLKQGSTKIATATTNNSGAYSIANILPGHYNLVASKDGKTVTTLVTVVDKDIQENITIPTAITNNSVLEVGGDTGAAAPNVVVGGLETVAETENANITMTVTAKAEDKGNAEQIAIKAETGNQKVAQFLDITLKKGTDDIGDSNTVVLEIVQPFSFSGKTDVTVWRYHGSAVTKLTKLESKPVAPFTDGTYFADSKSGLIYVYAAKFSTYAVSYQEIIPGAGYSVTVNPSENGTVKADKTTATFGEEVTITATPNTGYKFKSLSVTDANGKAIAYTDKKNGSFTFAMPNSNVTVAATFAKPSKSPFIDVADDAYYFDAVLWAVDKGITNGTSATTFSPNMTCTRAQTVTFLWRAMGSPEPTTTSCPFTDVATNSYYYKAVLWAVEKGITIGTSETTFSPDNIVTRGQTVTFLWRTAGAPAATTTNPFGDVSSDAYYSNAVLWAVSKGITSGTSTTTFSPIDGCSRAQIVTFLYRYMGK